MDRKNSIKQNKKSTIKAHRGLLKATQRQIGGDHYKSYSIAPIEFITKNKLSFIQGCIIKYICRFESKNGIEDLEKIKHYCDLQIQMLKNKK